MNAHTTTLDSYQSEGDVRGVPDLAGPQTSTLASRALEDLQADYERQSGHLSWDDVHQIVLGRALAARDAVEVWEQASGRFPLAERELTNPAASGETELLTATEERILTRRVAAARLASAADQAGILPAPLKELIRGMGKAAFDRLVSSNSRPGRVDRRRFRRTYQPARPRRPLPGGYHRADPGDQEVRPR